MASRFWVGGTGTWDASTTTHWSATSGGSGGASVPTSADTVTIDANSGSPTITLGANTASAPITVTGGTNTLTSAGFTVTGNITVNGSTATLQLGDALTCSLAITLTAGTFNTNSKSVACTQFVSTGTTARTLTLSSTMTISNGGSLTLWNVTSTGLTLTMTSGAIVLNATGSVVFNGGGVSTYGSVTIQSVNVNATITPTITGANTFTSLIVTAASAGAATSSPSVTLSANQTVTGTLTFAGTSTKLRLFVQSDTLGTQRTITNTGATQSGWQYVDFRDIALSTVYDASAITGGSGDCGGNSGITFTTSASQNWTNNAGGSWSTAGNWSGRVPLPQDDVTFNCAFQSAKTVTLDMPRAGRSIDWSSATWTGTATTFAFTTSFSLYGSLTLVTGLTLSAGANSSTFEGRGSTTLKSAGISFFRITISAFGGTVTLSDAMSMSSTFTINNGTFDAAGYNVTALSVVSNGGFTRTLSLGSGTWTIPGTSGTLWSLTSTAQTLNAGTSTIVFSDGGTGAKTFAGAGFTYNNLSIMGGGTGAVTINDSNTFNTLTINAPKSVQFSAGTTQTVSSFVARGSAGNLITVTSSSSGTAATLTSSAIFQSCDYLSLKDSSATGSQWFAGANSTNVSGNSGWVFTAAVVSQPLSASTSTFAGIVNRATAHGFNAQSTAMSGSVPRQTGKIVSAQTSSFSGSNGRATSKALTGITAAMQAAVTKRAARSFAAATAACQATVAKLVGRPLGAVSGQMAGGVTKGTGKAITATTSVFIGSIPKSVATGFNATTAAFSGAAGKVVETSRSVFSAVMTACSAVLHAVHQFAWHPNPYRLIAVPSPNRTMQVNTGMVQVTRYASDVLDYVVDWSRFVSTSSVSDSLASVEWIVPPDLTVQRQSNTNTLAVVWLGGGTVGTVSQVTCRATTNQGRTRDFTFEVLTVDEMSD